VGGIHRATDVVRRILEDRENILDKMQSQWAKIGKEHLFIKARAEVTALLENSEP
jgi:hypothetical protein